MPGRKKPSVGEWTTVLDEMRRHGVILEEMRSQNRATIEVVEARYESLSFRLDDMQEDTKERFAVVEGSIRSLAEETRRRDEGLAAAIQQVDEGSRARDEALATQVRQVDEGSRARDEALAGKVEALSRLEDRVTALEKRVP
jgi:hypothetical protein